MSEGMGLLSWNSHVSAVPGEPRVLGILGGVSAKDRSGREGLGSLRASEGSCGGREHGQGPLLGHCGPCLVPDLGRTYPSHRWDPDTSIVRQGN